MREREVLFFFFNTKLYLQNCFLPMYFNAFFEFFRLKITRRDGDERGNKFPFSYYFKIRNSCTTQGQTSPFYGQLILDRKES